MISNREPPGTGSGALKETVWPRERASPYHDKMLLLQL